MGNSVGGYDQLMSLLAKDKGTSDGFKRAWKRRKLEEAGQSDDEEVEQEERVDEGNVPETLKEDLNGDEEEEKDDDFDNDDDEIIDGSAMERIGALEDTFDSRYFDRHFYPSTETYQAVLSVKDASAPPSYTGAKLCIQPTRHEDSLPPLNIYHSRQPSLSDQVNDASVDLAEPFMLGSVKPRFRPVISDNENMTIDTQLWSLLQTYSDTLFTARSLETPLCQDPIHRSILLHALQHVLV